MTTAQIRTAGAGRTRTAPARAPDGFPFGFSRYRSYTLFGFTAFPMALAAVMLLFGVAALGRGAAAWQGYLESLSSAPAILLSLVLLGFTLYFAIRFGWVGRKIGAGRVGPIPPPPAPLVAMGVVPIIAFAVCWLLILAILGGAFS